MCMSVDFFLRFELSILFGLILILELFSKRLSLVKFLSYSLPVGVALLGNEY